MDNSKKKYYSELHRPQYHFSPEVNWMNDPNGLVFFDNEYHLFYQYNPVSTVWGPMHWGHAISKDLIHWEHLPIAMSPDSLGDIFSGSVVVDWNNTSGFGRNDKPPMVAIFTHYNRKRLKAGYKDYEYQSIAFSNDKGRTWTKYSGNPVIPNPGIKDFRDPKVIWHKATNKWILVLAAYDRVRIYTSENLINWKYASEFGVPNDKRLWECPDLFPLKVEGTNEEKWVLIVSILKNAPNGGTGTLYFIGDFNGINFSSNSSEQKWIDYGTDNYAFVTYSDLDKITGRRVGIGWMSNWIYAKKVPTKEWRSAMTAPRELKLSKEENNYVVKFAPIGELSNLQIKSEPIITKTINRDFVVVDDPVKKLYKLELSFFKHEKMDVSIRFSNDVGDYLLVGFSTDENAYFIDRTNAGKSNFSDQFAKKHFAKLDYNSNSIEMIIYLDYSSVELFADGGRRVMTDIFFPKKPYYKIEILSNLNGVQLNNGSITELNRIWSLSED